MSREHFEALGLPPGAYSRDQLRRRFEDQRRDALRAMDAPRAYSDTRERLEALYVAHRALRAAGARAEAAAVEESRLDELRRVIAANLEDDLLRHSRRQMILRKGAELGFSEFHTHLLIAQVQIGRSYEMEPMGALSGRASQRSARVGARLAATGILALAMLLGLIRYSGV